MSDIDSGEAFFHIIKFWGEANRPRRRSRKKVIEDEYDTKLATAFRVTAETLREFHVPVTDTALAYFAFRGLHPELLDQHGPTAERYRRERVGVLIHRAIEFLDTPCAMA